MCGPQWPSNASPFLGSVSIIIAIVMTLECSGSGQGESWELALRASVAFVIMSLSQIRAPCSLAWAGRFLPHRPGVPKPQAEHQDLWEQQEAPGLPGGSM